MGENNSKWSNRQRVNLKNIQATPAAQFQKKKRPNQKNEPKNWTDISPKTYRWLTNTWKDAQHHSLSEKCKSKPQGGIVSCRSEWLLSKSLQTINVGEGAEKSVKLFLHSVKTLLHCWWECKLVQPQWRIMWRCLKKLEIELPYHPGISLLGKTELKETRVPQCSSQHCLQ